MKTILVPVNLPDAAEHTLVYANKLAVRLGAEVVLLYCHHGAALSGTETAAYEKHLSTLAERLRYVQLVRQDGRRIRYRYAVRSGCLHDHVQSVIGEYGAELLIMNLEYTDCHEKATSGNHAVRITELASCPVLVVPPGIRQLPARLAFLADFARFDFSSLSTVGTLARRLAAQLQLVHFYRRIDLSTLISTKKNLGAIQENLTGVRSVVKLVLDDDPLEGIGDFCAQQHTQLLIFAPSDSAALRRFFDVSYIKTQAYHTRIPTLVLRPATESVATACCEHCAQLVAQPRPVVALPDYWGIRWA